MTSRVTLNEFQALVRNLVKEQVLEAFNPASGESYDRHTHGYLASMTWGQMPSDELLELALADGWHMNLNGNDGAAFDTALKLKKINPMTAERAMSTVQGMKAVIQALATCESRDPRICERAHDLASSIMDTLGFEWI